MDILIHTAERACVLVTLTFILAQTGSFAGSRRHIGPREQVAAILIFLVMALTEEFIAQRNTPMNARIIAACAAGLLAGPAVGGGLSGPEGQVGGEAPEEEVGLTGGLPEDVHLPGGEGEVRDPLRLGGPFLRRALVGRE